MIRASRTAILIFGLAASACSSTTNVAAPETLSMRSERERIHVRADDEAFATIELARGKAVSISELYAKGERHVLRGYPIVPRPAESNDHPEQRGLFIGHGLVEASNCWIDPSRVQLVSESVHLVGASAAVLELGLHWLAQDGVLLCDEKRTLRFESTPEARLIDVTMELRAPGGGVTFQDVREGLIALRMDDAFALGGLNPLRSTGEGSSWIAASGDLLQADGLYSPVTVALFDHPSNHGFPTKWHVRSYGLMAANPFGVDAFEMDDVRTIGAFEPQQLRGTHRIEPYGSMTLYYRVVIAPGELDADAVEALWAAYAGVDAEASTAAN